MATSSSVNGHQPYRLIAVCGATSNDRIGLSVRSLNLHGLQLAAISYRASPISYPMHRSR